MSTADPAETSRDPGAADARKLAGVLSSQLVGRGLHLVVNVLSTLAVIRYLSPDRYGDYVIALTIVMLGGLLSDGGLAKLAIREVAQNATSQDAATGSVVVLRLSLSLLAFGAAQLTLLALGAGADVHLAAALLSLTYATETLFSVATIALHLRLRQDIEAGARLFGELVETAVLLTLIVVKAGFVFLFAAPVIGGLCGAVVACAASWRRCHIRLSFDRSVIGRFFREAVPLVPALLVGVIALRLDGILLAALRSEREVGLYGSSFQPVEYVFLATAVVITTAFPALAAAWAIDRERFRNIYQSTTSVLLSCSLVVPLLALVVGGPAVTAVFGPDYAEATPILQILTVCLPLMGLNAWHAFVLLAGGHQRLTLGYDVAALATAAIVHPLLIHFGGTRGAALGTLSVMLFVFVCSTYMISSRMRLAVSPASAARPLVSLLVAYGVGRSASALGVPWIVVGGISAFAYLALAFGIRAVSLIGWIRLLGASPMVNVNRTPLAVLP